MTSFNSSLLSSIVHLSRAVPLLTADTRHYEYNDISNRTKQRIKTREHRITTLRGYIPFHYTYPAYFVCQSATTAISSYSGTQTLIKPIASFNDPLSARFRFLFHSHSPTPVRNDETLDVNPAHSDTPRVVFAEKTFIIF